MSAHPLAPRFVNFLAVGGTVRTPLFQQLFAMLLPITPMPLALALFPLRFSWSFRDQKTFCCSL